MIKTRRGCYRVASTKVSRFVQPKLLFLLVVFLLGFVTVLTFFSWFSSRDSVLTFFNTPPSSPERNYGVVIDAGSSSSKLHLFQWPPHDGDPAKLLTIKPMVDELGDPLMKKVDPGVATFSSSPATAFTALQPLLEFALEHIPASCHQHTSLYIFCTAGMRLLPKQDRDQIVAVLRTKVANYYPFHLPKDSIQVISGKMEGVFSWIAINYLVGRLSPESHHLASRRRRPAPPTTPSDDITSTVLGAAGKGSSDGGPSTPSIHTVGSLDLGGASLQVAFEVPPDLSVPVDLTMDINLGCGMSEGNQHKHRIFVNTYLGYGSNQARLRYYQQLLKLHLKNSNHSQLEDAGTHLHSLRDPCAPLGAVDNMTVKGHVIKIRGLGDFYGCKRALAGLLRTDSKRNGSGDPHKGAGSADSPASSQLPCIGGSSCNDYPVHDFHKPILKYEALDFYGTSEFWYTMRDILRIGGHYTAYSYETSASKYCQTPWRILLDRFMKRLYGSSDFYRLRSQCMKSAWLSVILHEGLGFPKDSISLHSVSRIDGQSVQWPLGALIYHTRFLPLREVQLQHQLQAPPVAPSQLHYFFQSSFLLPLTTVLVVVLLLLCCRHRRNTHRPPYPTFCSSAETAGGSLSRTQSLNALRVHKRGSSYTSASSLQLTKMGGSGGGSQVDGSMTGDLDGSSSSSSFGLERDYSRSKFMV